LASECFLGTAAQETPTSRALVTALAAFDRRLAAASPEAEMRASSLTALVLIRVS